MRRNLLRTNFIDTLPHHIAIPSYLCPRLFSPSIALIPWPLTPNFKNRNSFHTNAIHKNEPVLENPTPASTILSSLPASVSLPVQLPLVCPGCGAYSQTTAPDDAGYYSPKKKPTKAYLKSSVASIQDDEASTSNKRDEEERVVQLALESVDETLLKRLGLNDITEKGVSTASSPATPVCNRCHNLVHHNVGTSVINPSISAIREIIAESPHLHNHVYHVLDAADFPLSLLPKISSLLELNPQRSVNRRSKSVRYSKGGTATLSFIITRSDLLAPLKEQVDGLMPYLVKVLRDALDLTGEGIRLGNVRCVSSKRGWWTKTIKEEVWNRGGGGWMVGKVNVGKSSLFEGIYPKGGALKGVDFEKVRLAARGGAASEENTLPSLQLEAKPAADDNNNGLLPPSPAELPYPTLPTTSHLPGTTASPIRLPFGTGRGELIDLPGLSRHTLAPFVNPSHQASLIMHSRIKPEQQVLKPGSSLLLGGLIRLTPLDPDTIILAYAFLPFTAHRTSTEKALAILAGERLPGREVGSIAREGAGKQVVSAGVFELKWEVTRERAGPLVKKQGKGLKPEQLPFRVLALDVLIEGAGWVEVVAQVRRRRRDVVGGGMDGDGDGNGEKGDALPRDTPPEDVTIPRIEVFSPLGLGIGVRRPMNAWLLNGPKPGAKKRGQRPARSMKGAKRRGKIEARKGSVKMKG
ncbi:MAG: hypothetical protein M1829_003403 [Trizodia sp. TS-e1964]|nr:MAG: hypothetical protein M1829_003403 [Trizodia sp. TS-e1964]